MHKSAVEETSFFKCFFLLHGSMQIGPHHSIEKKYILKCSYTGIELFLPFCSCPFTETILPATVLILSFCIFPPQHHFLNGY